MNQEIEQLNSENIEIELLLQAIYMKYGYDFHGYARASLKRRLKGFMQKSGKSSISQMQHDLLHDSNYFDHLLKNIFVNTTEMFRDPYFYKALGKHVLSELAQLDIIKIWHAGCASGEEVYSMAILLKEAGIYDKSIIYATDIDENALNKAKEGVYPAKSLKAYTQNYISSGGIESFADYYSARYELVIMDSSLKKNILFSEHNLVTDSVFSEVNIIVCRNVLIYFNRELQDRVIGLFKDSLSFNGYLCLGPKETVRLSRWSDKFEDALVNEKIYRKI